MHVKYKQVPMECGVVSRYYVRLIDCFTMRSEADDSLGLGGYMLQVAALNLCGDGPIKHHKTYKMKVTCEI